MPESTQTAHTSAQIGAPLRPSDPTSLGRYDVLRRLGQGGMGTVYLARTADSFVAVKVVKPEFAEDAQFTVISGPTLEETVHTSGPLGSSDLEGLAVGMAAALSAIHAADVIHRDLKPSNVLLSPVGPRVIDFGIARALEFTTAGSSQIVGTPAFMAPEQVRATGIGPATDIFAWGGMLAFASSGEPAFGSGNAAALMYRIIHEEPDLRALDGDLRQLVEAAMSKKGRPANVAAAVRCAGRATGPSRYVLTYDTRARPCRRDCSSLCATLGQHARRRPQPAHDTARTAGEGRTSAAVVDRPACHGRSGRGRTARAPVAHVRSDWRHSGWRGPDRRHCWSGQHRQLGYRQLQ